MSKGRPKLTQRNKMYNKLAKLQREIENIRTLLSGRFIDEIEEIKLEEELTLDQLNPEDINRRNGCKINIEDNKED